ncbi:hypothetical protein BpHYR1_013349 [Brachionus plicatilis]|uniref:Uncharacterized protein n=1 Tax=Brachionus plicatilis TaxID=10195 RepID=A0A3M7Q9Q9_BRAPC|nr:hypothetical protein BpHYR1_013349 [Brachionus plicatilis]
MVVLVHQISQLSEFYFVIQILEIVQSVVNAIISRVEDYISASKLYTNNWAFSSLTLKHMSTKELITWVSLKFRSKYLLSGYSSTFLSFSSLIL